MNCQETENIQLDFYVLTEEVQISVHASEISFIGYFLFYLCTKREKIKIKSRLEAADHMLSRIL